MVYMRRLVLLLSKCVEPNSEDEDSRRREFILNVLLLGAIIFSSLAVIRIVVDYTMLDALYRGESPLIPFLVVVFLLALYFFSRGGLSAYIEYLFVGIFFFAATYTVYSWGIDIPQGLLMYVLVIVMSGVLISTRFALIITLVTSFILLLFAYFQNNSITYPDLYWKKEMLGVDDAITIVATLSIITLVSWLSNREIEKSLKRARRSEKDLKDERDLLEVKVEERTKELQKVQFEKLIQLQHFTDFGRITSGLLHDVVNPLASITLNLENLKKKSNSPEIVARTSRALGNIRRIKDIVIAGRNQIQKQEINILFSPSEQISLAIQMLSFKARKLGIDVEFTPPHNVLETYGNFTKFYRVMTSLISNAIDSYNSEEIKTFAQGKIIIIMQHKNDTLVFMIQDFGCGIATENLSKIFDPLFTTKCTETGTGIGLTICKTIIEDDFGGNITVQSKEGEGSTFTVRFNIRKK